MVTWHGKYWAGMQTAPHRALLKPTGVRSGYALWGLMKTDPVKKTP